MARITVEDCLKRENNRFALVLLASKRTKQLLGGSKVLLDEHRNNKAVVTALREIASGQVRFMTAEEKQAQDEARAQAAAEARASSRAELISAAPAAVESLGGALFESAPPSGGDQGSNNGGEEPPPSSDNNGPASV